MLVLTGSISLAFGWGAWGHQHINRAAVFALPAGMRSYFYNHIDFITEESVVPDLRKYALGDKAEFDRHYIDLEYFGEHAVDTLPRTMKEARLHYPDSVFRKYGTLPWWIQEMEEKLTTAFKQKRKTEILFLAADLAHYLGDATMPLHTALNHNGKLTGQLGIHGFWESQLPELFGEHYNLYTGAAQFIPDITTATWSLIAASHALEDSVLLIDRQLSAGLSKGQVYVLDSTGAIKTNKFGDYIHTHEYAKKYHDASKGMIERQIRAAIRATANFWYTAWVNAGSPDLGNLDPSELTEANRSRLDADFRLWQTGRLSGLRADKEY